MEVQKNKQTKMFELRATKPGSSSKGGVFGKGRILIGRTESCDLIVNNDAVSAVHAVMEIFDTHARIYDMNSTNGTYVNDEKIIVKDIHVGDFFRMADTEFEFSEYSAEESLPPVLDTLEPVKGEASVKLPDVPKELPKAAPTVSHEAPSIVYPLASDPKAEFSEYIFEDKDELYPIFKYEAAKQAVEVIILFNDKVFSVDYLPEGKGTYYITGVHTKKDELEFPYLGKNDKYPFVEVRGPSALVHTIPGFGVFLLSDKKKDTGHVGTSVELSGQDLLRLQKDHLQIFVRNVQAPPQIAAAPILKRDPEFRKFLLLFLFIVGSISVALNVIEVPEDPKKDELAPERLATILYKETIQKNIVEPKKEIVKAEAPKTPVNMESKEKPTETKLVKNADIVTTPDQSKKPDIGSKTADMKRDVKKGTTPVKQPDKRVFNSPPAKGSPTATGSKAPTAHSFVESKSAGHVEVYKSADFASSVSGLVAKGGSLSGVRAEGVSGNGGGSGNQLGISEGVVGGSGTVKTSKMTTTQGALYGSASGMLGESKGAEGLSGKRAIYTAGIPGETVVLGSMDPDAIRRILLEHLPQFRYCYQRELEKTGAEASGAIKLNFTIGASGHVAQAGVDGSSNLPTDVKKCVVGVLKGITFPEPMGGGTVEVKQPMNFYPKKI